MQVLMPFVVGGLFAAGLFMMLRRSIVKLIIGLALLGQAANLLIFTMGRLAPTADPLPQALILTAIVIGFGVQAFALVLIRRAYQTVGTDDLDVMNTTDT